MTVTAPDQVSVVDGYGAVVLDPAALSRPQRAALAVVRGLSGDFRDWAEIRRWAQEIAAQLGVRAAA